MRSIFLVGMLIPDGTNQFFSSLAQLFQRELAKRQAGLIVVNSDGSKAREISNLGLLLTMGLDGLVFISVGDSAEAFLKLADSSIPVLVLDREVPLENADFVVGDNAEGVRAALEYLRGLGHRRVACIQGSLSTEPGRERFRSFLETAKDYSFEAMEDLVFPGDFLFGSGAAAAERIIKMSPGDRPTAVFASNDLMAIGAMQRFQEEGIRIPGEISMIGYDDISLASWVYPRLTTIRQDPIAIARVGAALLLERLDQEAVDRTARLDSRVTTIHPTLIKRRSCVAPSKPVP